MRVLYWWAFQVQYWPAKNDKRPYIAYFEVFKYRKIQIVALFDMQTCAKGKKKKNNNNNNNNGKHGVSPL